MKGQGSISPKSLGYSMPAEWHPHSGTLLSWPVNRETWPGSRLDRVENVYLDIIRHLYNFERVHLIVHDDIIRDRVLKAFRGANLPDQAAVLHNYASDDSWARDFGPVFIKNQRGQAAVTNWEYNAWGEKYPPFENDNKIPDLIAGKLNLKSFSPGIVLEGGSVETNGKGVMLTTESVLLNPNRNPGYTQEQIEHYLKEYLGQEHIIWLKKGLVGDDTDGHIDDLSRFVSENTIVTALTDDPDDVNYEVLRENYDILRSARNLSGKRFDIIPIPMPHTRIEGTTVDGSNYVPASYANFYIANGIVLLPFYDDRYDQKVLKLFSRLFPDRKVVGIPCADLVWGQGGIHCITQQMYY